MQIDNELNDQLVESLYGHRLRGPQRTVLLIAGIAVMLALAPVLEKTLFHNYEIMHDLVWMIYAVPTALAAYGFGFMVAMGLGLLETAIIWLWDYHLQEFLATGQVNEIVLFLTVYNLVVAFNMGWLTERLRRQGQFILKANSLLQDMASRDHVTGLYNARTFHGSLQKALEVARGSGRPVGLIFIDVDQFKDFNDRYGHQAGNSVLAAVGRCVAQSVRSGDLPCRYGGDEFAVILPGANSAVARKVAERIQESVRELRSEEGEMWQNLTLSLGLAVHPEHAADAALLVSAADGALYDAKRFGRNRVAVAGEEAGAGGYVPVSLS